MDIGQPVKRFVAEPATPAPRRERVPERREREREPA